MVLVLCIGDLHIPHRATDLPAKFKQLLVPGKIHHSLCPGNICTKEIHDYLKTVCADMHVTKGDFDEDGSYPEDKVLKIGDFRIGMVHGHQIVPSGSKERLAFLARQMDVDILVTGHTHEFKADCIEGRLLINPGSATGAFNSLHDKVVPSFVLMDITGKKATLYVYEMKDSEMAVTKIEHPDPSLES
ncbi:hypothetical protein WJX79_002108 [Trebouxia sp. C0005]|nr:MAG: vacuolar sorting-associated 29 [Trebouxia sp. A1-2]